MSERHATSSTWAPLRVTLYRWLWLASLGSNVGAWMQTVGAQWLLIHAAGAAILVSLVQTADMLPDVMFALVGGVIADNFDRRRVLMTVQCCLGLAAVALALLTIEHEMTPGLLLMFTFIIGTGSVFVNPAYQSLVPELVPTEQIPAAIQLTSININIARAVGPAISGVLISVLGVGAVFALNAATFFAFALVIVLWRPTGATSARIPEPFVSALRAGGRYVRYSPTVRRIFLRAALFLVPASALWALLPLVASRRLALGSGGYGLLLGALGVGAIVGASTLSRVRTRISTNGLISGAGVAYGAALAVVVATRSTAAVVVVLVPAGVAWVVTLATVNTVLQLFLPRWVRARGLSVFQMVLYGAQGLGAVAWGAVAYALGLSATFYVAAGLMILGAATIRLWPLIDTSNMDRQTVVMPDPNVTWDPTTAGAIVVRTVYTISADKEADFLRAMRDVREMRLRTGATQWSLYRDGERPHEFEELFVVDSWDEHLRQHRERMTATDLAFENEAKKLSDTDPPTVHLLPADPDSPEWGRRHS